MKHIYILFSIPILTCLLIHSSLLAQNVGIGISSPASKFSIKGGLSIGSNYAGNQQAPTDGALIQGKVGIGATSVPSESNLVLGAVNSSIEGGQLQLNATNSNNDDQAFFIDNYKDKLRFLYGTNANSLGDFMTIDSTGDLGIGTQTPTAKLDVVGQIRIRGGSPSSGKVLATSNANGDASWQDPNGLIDDDYLPNDPATSDVDMNGNQINNVSRINMGTPARIRTTGTGSIEMYDATNNYRIASFYEGGKVTVMNGNVGIGSSGPSEKLDVSGNLRLSSSIEGGADDRLNIYNNTSAGTSRAWLELWGEDASGPRDGELTLAGTYVAIRTASTTSATGDEAVIIDSTGQTNMNKGAKIGNNGNSMEGFYHGTFQVGDDQANNCSVCTNSSYDTGDDVLEIEVPWSNLNVPNGTNKTVNFTADANLNTYSDTWAVSLQRMTSTGMEILISRGDDDDAGWGQDNMRLHYTIISND